MDILDLEFLGATKTVTGSKTLIHYNKYKILVDCGLFQGPKEIRDQNWKSIPGASKFDCVVLTHAHIDHSGYLPRIVKEGFKNPIYCSYATKALCDVLLMDAAHLQEEDAEFANRTRYSRHDPALPLYTSEEAISALRLFKPLESQDWIEILPGVRLRFLRSGHILGSRFVQLSFDRFHGNEIITFSGDIGHDRSRVLKGPVTISETDTLVLESTYGDRRHSRLDPLEGMENIVNKVIGRGGTLIIPAFAVGRTQEVLFLLTQLIQENRIDNLPVYIDSPMALEATDIYLRHSNELKVEVVNGYFESPISPSDFYPINKREESEALCKSNKPKIVISAAGMLSGGRVLHHLKSKLPDSKSAVLFTGYQASGTKGLLLKNGLKEIFIHHERVPVNAEIFVLEGLSAHADSEDIMKWLSNFKKFPKTIYLNHGETNAIESLRYMIKSRFECNIVEAEKSTKYKL